MKLKRKIGVLMCCLAVMGVFLVSGLYVEALQQCTTHPGFIVGLDAVQDSYYTASGHYEVRGDVYECPKCKYSYWEGLYTIKTGEHYFEEIGEDAYHRPIYSDYCSYCPYKR